MTGHMFLLLKLSLLNVDMRQSNPVYGCSASKHFVKTFIGENIWGEPGPTWPSQ